MVVIGSSSMSSSSTSSSLTSSPKTKSKLLKSGEGHSIASSAAAVATVMRVAPGNDPEPDDPKASSSVDLKKGDDESGRKKWIWRVAKMALPVQIAIVTLFCAACLLEPHCCDALNNLSMSFTPQLRYVRGPPPV